LEALEVVVEVVGSLEKGKHSLARRNTATGDLPSLQHKSVAVQNSWLRCYGGQLCNGIKKYKPDLQSVVKMTCLTHTVTATATVTIMMDPSSPLHRTSSYHAANGSQADTLLFGSDGMLTASDDIFSAHSMKKSPSGYFNAKPMRGSSPTASLAADLSQNFHIAQRYF
jgi:hypothetical protein